MTVSQDLQAKPQCTSRNKRTAQLSPVLKAETSMPEQSADMAMHAHTAIPKRRGRPRKVQVESAPLLAGLDLHAAQEPSKTTVSTKRRTQRTIQSKANDFAYKETTSKATVKLPEMPENKVLAPWQKMAAKNTYNSPFDFASHPEDSHSDMSQHHDKAQSKGGVLNHAGSYTDYAPYPDYVDPTDYGMSASTSLDDYVLGDGPSDADYAAFLASLGEAADGNTVPDWSEVQEFSQANNALDLSVPQGANNQVYAVKQASIKQATAVHQASSHQASLINKSSAQRGAAQSAALASQIPHLSAQSTLEAEHNIEQVAPTADALVAQAQNALAMLHVAHSTATPNPVEQNLEVIQNTVQAQNSTQDINAKSFSAVESTAQAADAVDSANNEGSSVNHATDNAVNNTVDNAADMEHWLAAISGFASVNALQSEKQHKSILDNSSSSVAHDQASAPSHEEQSTANMTKIAASTQKSNIQKTNTQNSNTQKSEQESRKTFSIHRDSVSTNYEPSGFLDEDELASDSLASDDVSWKKQGLGADEFAAAVRPEKSVLTPEILRQVAENIAVNKQLTEIKNAEAITIERNKTGEIVFDNAMHAQCCQPINLSCIKYLMDHYPMSSLEEQSKLNVVLMCLFQKMQDGHICINLDSVVNLFYIIREWGSKYTFRSNIERPIKEEQRLENELRDSLVANVPLSDQELLALINKSQAVTEDGSQELPLVWDCNRLYVRRYYLYEQRICNYIKSVQFHDFEQTQKNKIREMINVLFPAADDALLEDKTNWQKVAALMSVMSDFTVISGGPGTGKTTTVFKLLLLLLNMDSKNRNILMCAPTAKAAARMGESISNQLKNAKNQKIISYLCGQDKAQEEIIRSLIPMQAETVHKLLKVRPHLSTPIFNENNKLNCDVLIVDEVSMLEMSLFAKLLAALPDGCKLILLGDKDQLSSVGAGMVLGDICSILNSTSPQRIQPQVLDFLQECSGYSQEQLLKGKIADHIVLLNYSWRSKDVPEIGQLAKLFNDSESFSTTDDSSLFRKAPENIFARLRLVNEIVSGQRVFKESKKNREYYDDRISKIEQAFTHAASHALTQTLALEGDAAYKPALERQSVQNRALEMGAAQIDYHEQSSLHDSIEPQHKTSSQAQAAPLVLHTIPEALDNSNAAFSQQVKQMVKDRMQQIRMQLQPNELEEFAYAYKHPFNPVENRWLSEIMSSIREERSSEVRELRDNLVQSWVDPAGTDNYAPFLNALREADFKVNPNSDKCIELFNLMDKFRVLCSNHSDWFGDSNLNERMCLEVLKQYHHSEKQSFTKGEFFPGQIVLITENDPLLNLVNGSVGFCAYADYDDDSQAYSFSDYIQARAAAQNKLVPKTLNFAEPYKNKDTKQQLKVFIPMGVKEEDGKSRTQVHVISTLLLHHYDIGYAMSIHKSQGSEYDHVAIVLSQHVNPILTKELVYTGITRAKKRVDLVASYSALRHALSHAVVRESGLSLRLYDPELLAHR